MQELVRFYAGYRIK